MEGPFVKLKIVSSKPGNAVRDCWLRVGMITSVSAADDEFIRIGGASSVITQDGMFISVDHPEDVITAILEAEKKA